MKQTQSKKGQITIFILIGILLLSGVIFLTYITTTINRDKLLEQQTNVIKGLLNSQSVEVFTSDCTKNALKTGLITIGKNGGYKKIKPDLLRESTDGNYTMLITRPKPEDAPPKYPCFGKPKKPPFCKYPNPDKTRFGKKNNLILLQSSSNVNTINGQLKEYIKEFVENCIEDNLSKIPSFAQYDIKINDPTITLNLPQINEIVEAKIKIPIEMSIGGTEPIIRLTRFDTKIPLRFREIYKLASTVIDKELTNVTYDPTNELTPINITIIKNPGIDSFYTIEDKQHPIDGQPYIFKFAIQNRPPALHYINKTPTPLYDYLAIKKDDKNITINPKADDPDEDNVRITDRFLSKTLNKIPLHAFVYDITTVNPGWYNLSINATDLTGQEDNQTVRILIDKKINSTFNNTFYKDIPEELASIEDPYFLNATKETSLDPNADITYTWAITGFDYLTTNEMCIDLNKNKCDIKNFKIENKKGAFFKNPTRDIGTVSLTTKVDYKPRTQTDNSLKAIKIQKCLPHKNKKHPWAYPYEKETDNDEDGVIDGTEPINPFLSTHACCSDQGEYLDENTICGEEVSLFCKDNTVLYKEGKRQFCDGTRGNVCQGKVKNFVEEKQNQCGSSKYKDCKVKSSFLRVPKTSEKIGKKIDVNCQSQIPFSKRKLAKNNKGICLGPTGCEAFCTTEWVDQDNSGDLTSQDTCGCRNSLFGAGDNNKNCFRVDNGQEGKCQSGACV